MNREGNTYTFIYSIVLVVIVAALLSFIALSLQPKQNENIENEKRQNILASVHIVTSPENSKSDYDKYITESYIVNINGEKTKGDAFKVDLSKEVKKERKERLLPIYIASINGEKKYILPFRGTGLWGPLWGYMSFNEDKNTIYGVIFDHKGETPGLGAEITTKAFENQFDGKLIFKDNNLTSIEIKKGGGATGKYQVDAISGGTITSKGVENMLKDYLECYESFLKNKN